MATFSRKSWHYRLNIALRGDCDWNLSDSVCGYFWQTVCSLVAVSVAGLFLGGFSALILNGIALVLLAIFTSVTFDALGGSFANSFDLASLLLVMVMIVATVADRSVHYAREWSIERCIKKRLVNKPDSVLLSYVKAVREKVCPMIDWTNE